MVAESTKSLSEPGCTTLKMTRTTVLTLYERLMSFTYSTKVPCTINERVTPSNPIESQVQTSSHRKISAKLLSSPLRLFLSADVIKVCSAGDSSPWSFFLERHFRVLTLLVPSCVCAISLPGSLICEALRPQLTLRPCMKLAC